ncbi:MAG: HAMP domain-containing histidine kinase, partial [Pontiellaceae bacterium]|nr:HAMP domain-containing histidine kinase [Pontiellaceae bacterium]
AAIVLPTVSLLWFMSRVVINERLVIRQKLATLYEGELKEASAQAQHQFLVRLNALNSTDWLQNPNGLLRRLVLEEHFQGVLIWSSDGPPAFPSAGGPSASNVLSDEQLNAAWQLEFVEQDMEAAAERYAQLAASGDPRSAAGQIRCLAKLERWDAAFAAAIANADPSSASTRLLLLTQLKEAGMMEEHPLTTSLVEQLAADLFKPGAEFLPSTQNLLVARRFLETLQGTELDAVEGFSASLKQLIAAESLSLTARDVVSVADYPVDQIRRINSGAERLYAVRHSTPLNEILILMDDEGLMSALSGYRDALADAEVQFRVFDVQGRLIGGDAGEGIDTIVSAPLPTGSPEGHIELFFENGDMFNKAAGRQITVYIWTGAMVILVILLVGIFAGQAVGRQIRLNKMKNNFIATVSHELKTPLASMRLLVDTLLEKRVRDEAHAEEYLNMIARENERLTRVIENFLSFSRMERNRNAFTMLPTAPADIVEDAVESICTKYKANGCKLEMDLAHELPEITVDSDALVTVLINLLDNACKYTGTDKQIRLSLTVENEEVCFAVSDNGIGLTRRQIRKIFNHFYQVDSSLARSSEGCGLGLSIVWFIVNAHKGRIDVESRPGEGSTFSVHLPRND